MSRAKRLQKAVSNIENELSDIECLRDEISDWKSSLEGTNFENTQKYSDLEECEESIDTAIDNIRDALNDLDDVEFPQMYG